MIKAKVKAHTFDSDKDTTATLWLAKEDGQVYCNLEIDGSYTGFDIDEKLIIKVLKELLK